MERLAKVFEGLVGGVLFYGGCFFGICLLVGGDGFLERLGGLACIAIGVGPFIRIWLSNSKRKASWAKLYREMLEAGGVAPGQGRDHFEQGTGIAFNPQTRKLLLLADGVYKSYDYGEVREWVDQEARARTSIVVGGGMAGSLASVALAAGGDANATENTGFFVGVRDRVHSKWRISMKDKATRERWMEVLRQEVNEGR